MQTASIKWIGDQKFAATSPSGHTIAIDSDRQSNTAPGPMELVLMALGACTATDVVIILEKKRQTMQSLEVICSGERATEPPTVWVKLEILFRLRGDLDDAAVKRAIELSEEKYCSVSATLKKNSQTILALRNSSRGIASFSRLLRLFILRRIAYNRFFVRGPFFGQGESWLAASLQKSLA